MERKFEVCPRCGANLIKTTAFSGCESEFWYECCSCNTYVNSYVPQEHQFEFHSDDHTFLGNFGGYGTGKTLTSREEIYKHIFLTPNANILIGANTSPQYEQTIKRELENDIPRAFVKDYSVRYSYMDLINGARIMYRPLADVDNLRSYNLTMFVIVEASEVPMDAYSQLKTRLRNLKACQLKRDRLGNIMYNSNSKGVTVPIIESDWLRGIVESNPDSGWIRSEVLLAADRIHKHGTVLDEYQQNEDEKDPATSAHVSSTDVNAYLPKDYIKRVTQNKPGWWVSRYILGSFSYAEGLVYPSAIKTVIPYFDVQKNWKRVIAFDYGLHDDAVYLCGAVDPINGILYIYKEVRKNDMNIDHLSDAYWNEVVNDIPSGGFLCTPIADPKSVAKRDYDKKSLGDHFLEHGILFEPGFVNVDARIYRLNTYLESGRLKIMDNCVGLIKELKEYKFKPKTLEYRIGQDKPVDKNNHAINPLEWIVMKLPSDPRHILHGCYDNKGNDLTVPIEAKDAWLPHALQDDPVDDDANWNYMQNLFGG